MKKVIISIMTLLGIGGLGYLGKKQVNKNKELINASDKELRKMGKFE